MPAHNLAWDPYGKTCIHIHNTSIEGTSLFKDDEDQDTFLQYLKEYVTEPIKKGEVKKTFTINGKTFQGTPHLPKNYYEKVDILAYRLESGRFDLIVTENEKGAVQSLLRSFATRYSMYFNKKHQRTGQLFSGPYKAREISRLKTLLDLSKDLHKTPKDPNTKVLASSSQAYKDDDATWIHKETLLSLFETKEDYISFIEEVENEKVSTFKDTEAQIGEEILARQNITSSADSNEEQTLLAEKITEKPRVSRFPEFIVLTAIFLLLFVVGLKNVETSQANTKYAHVLVAESALITESPEKVVPEVLAEENDEPYPLGIVTIKDGSKTINIRKEPSRNAEIVGEAKEDDSFEIISKEGKWYEIKYNNEKAFVSARYISIVEDSE